MSVKPTEKPHFFTSRKGSRSWQAMEFIDGKFAFTDASAQIHMIDPAQISPNPMQSRTVFDNEAMIALSNSIKMHGVLQPITVVKCQKESGSSEKFEIIAGERRLRAAKLIGMQKIPCIIMDVDKTRRAELSIVENIQREGLNFFEQASAIAALIDIYKLTQEETAQRLSVSQSFVANKLRLLRLNQKERELILKHNLTERHARALLRISGSDERTRIIEHIHSQNLGVAATEAYIECFLSQKQEKFTERPPSRMIFKDIRVFYNSVDRAVSAIKRAGINVETQRIDENGVTVLTIRIPNNVSRETL